MRGFLLGLVMGVISLSVFGSPTFTDQGLDAGYLNPGDVGIPVQRIRVSGDPRQDTMLYAVTVRNDGTANHIQIVRVEVWDAGQALAVISNTTGIASGGVTASMAYTVPAGETRDLWLKVWIGGVGSVSGGETVRLAAKFFYTVGGTFETSDWISDGKAETILKAGFDRIRETGLSPAFLNPGDTATVQVTEWSDADANASPITVQRIRIQNIGTATADDVTSVTIKLRHGGGSLPPITITNLAGWERDGVVVDPRPLVINDQDTLVCEVEVTVSLTPTDSRTIRTRVTLELEENGQPLTQASAGPATFTIARSGLEEVRDESRVPTPNVLNPGERLVQTIVLRDRDANDFGVDLREVWVRNIDGNTATGAEISEITVAGPGWSFRTTDTANFHTIGVSIPLIRVPTLPDDGELTITITYLISNNVVPGHTLRPQVRVLGEEFRGVPTWSPSATYPEAIYLYPPGLEIVENIPIRPSTIYSNQRVCVQKIRVQDLDQNRYSVLINPIVVRNLGTADAGDLVKLEIRTAEGELLAETTNLAGIRAAGVTLTASANNNIPDDGEVELWIWVTVAGPERNVTGRTVRLATTLFHTEGGAGYNHSAVSDDAFTLAVNNPPVVDFSYTPATPNWNDTITFTPRVTDPQDPPGRDRIVYSRWEFGDGTVIELNYPQDDPLKQVVHKYGQGGNFQVTLTVRDDKGAEGSKTTRIGVTPNRPPVVDFSWDPSAPKWSDTVRFTPNVSDPDQDRLVSFKWDFGDGTPIVEKTGPETVTHKYGRGGRFTVKLTVTDEGGASATREKTIEITNAQPTVEDIEWTPAQPDWNDEITFTPKNPRDPDGDINKATFEWDFGDGTPVVRKTGPSPVTHRYGKGGRFTVKLKITDEGGASVTAEKNIEVTNTPPTVDFSWTPTSPQQNQEITFSPTATDPDGEIDRATFEWDFGDRTRPVTTTGPRNVTHTYAQAGTYTVTLTVTDQGGAVSTVRKQIRVEAVTPPPPQPPTVTNISISPANPEAGKPVTFTATATAPADDPVTQWEWDFGDGAKSTTDTNTVTHTYANPGQYTVRVVAKNKAGSSQPFTRQITVFPPGVTFGFLVLDNPVTGNQCRIQIFAPAGATDLKITILDQAGRPVILNKSVSVGTFTWDLKDQNGRIVPNGLYLFYITAKIEGQEKRTEIGRILVRR